MAPIRLGFVAFGVMGERLLRAALAHDPATVAVAGVWDPSPRAMERLAAALPEVPRQPGFDALLEASDCLYVASPPESHLAYARRALAAGRALFCEKPLAVDVEDARAFARESDGARAAVNFPFASSPAVDLIRDWVREGAVGPVSGLTIEAGFARWPRPWQEDAAGWLDAPREGGFTREVVSHFLFLARRLLGPLALAEAAVERPEAGRSERAVRARLTAGGTPAVLLGRVGATEKPDHNLWVLQGAAGAVRLRDWSVAERRDADGAWREASGALPNERMRPLVLARQLDKVAAMTRGQAHGLATIREAFDVQETVEAILRA